MDGGRKMLKPERLSFEDLNQKLGEYEKKYG